MNLRTTALLIAAVAALVAGLQHRRTVRARLQTEADTARLSTAALETRRLSAETARQLAALAAEPQNRPEAAVMKSVPPLPATAPTTDQPKSAATPTGPELRQMQVQAFVSEQRLRFAALLKQLGFTAEKLQAFDRIQGDFQQVTLDSSQSDASRQQVRQTRDAQLQELFGPAYDQWLDANRNQPARALVEQIVRQTFPGSGALTTIQAEELTRVVTQNRIPPSNPPAPGPARYDWDRIVTDARSILAERQLAVFESAIQFRRASEEMAAMVAKKKP
jgi:hypothetical protein